jgi:hypothetical protein
MTYETLPAFQKLETAIAMHVAGQSTMAIAAELGISDRAVRSLKLKPEFRRGVADVAGAVRDELRSELRIASRTAISTLCDLMADPTQSPATRIDAARTILTANK